LIDSWAPVFGALVGAVIGSLGSVWLSGRVERAKEARQRRDELVERYLYQLQAVLESLWYRFQNVIHRGGRGVMNPEYHLMSTLYLLGSLLAQKQCLVLQGVYARLEGMKPELGRDLRFRLEELDREIGRAAQRAGVAWHRYDRVTLAELTTRAGEEGCKLASYGEFRAKLEKERERLVGSIRPAEEFVDKLETPSGERLLALLKEIGEICAENTAIPFAPTVDPARTN
jgi:hypothetical protein